MLRGRDVTAAGASPRAQRAGRPRELTHSVRGGPDQHHNRGAPSHGEADEEDEEEANREDGYDSDEEENAEHGGTTDHGGKCKEGGAPRPSAACAYSLLHLHYTFRPHHWTHET